ncbi:bifunctional aspartate transaminase/aspartate 4-decarboxylase [Endozoicomonas euniceicola]|uniref:Aminotransferase n=1 Tax=Endozoicomonas euniceicola TaxID=1234143 RepID=A0ABY6GX49_9GAMM|nr:bifunctional aspartate transaminase/aspartate 4-decarboxylase [Endozoicomonas euniceicola]UYM16618.1 bifunctional aspartate transaminase/aspartate 4-decarboxylase [Endozoicomonas euniceicola]
MSDLNDNDSQSISPFEFKDQLLAIASSHADRMMLNAGRGNPNFLAIAPRRAFLQLGEFALQEAERSYSYLNSGFGGLPETDGMLQRFEVFRHNHEDAVGMRFIQAALSLVKDQLGILPEQLLAEMVNASLGCYYPQPMSMLKYFEPVVKAYLRQELCDGLKAGDDFHLFATEGGTAAMSYIFQSLHANGLLSAGDRVALLTPIFTPYLEIPELADYQLHVVELEADEKSNWQLSPDELHKLNDPDIKLLCLVNPSNPPSVALSQSSLQALTKLIQSQRQDLLVVTDDVYATFADSFISLFATCPRNTLCVYSFSKFFGATGWRLGVIALHKHSVYDQLVQDKNDDEVNARYASISSEPKKLPFLERLVADSRSVALHHSAGLSAPQQLQMTLFALGSLIDSEGHYQRGAKRLIRSRYQTLYQNIGLPEEPSESIVGYYTLLDLGLLASRLHSQAFADWFLGRHSCAEFLFRLADETGIVLLPAAGFDVHVPAVRVSLANLTLANYAAIGQFARQVLDEFFQEYCHEQERSLND